MKRQLILASASKRRSIILNSCGMQHRIVVSGIKEISRSKTPEKKVVEIAKKKAVYVAGQYKNAIIIGADTLVRVGRHLVGKPHSQQDARRLLKLFSGKKIEVFTGLYLIDTNTNKTSCGYAKSCIYVPHIAGNDINRYFRLLGSYDKAGGFSIEGVGSILFDNIRGSYFNILGLPMAKLSELFHNLGFNISDFILLRSFSFGGQVGGFRRQTNGGSGL